MFANSVTGGQLCEIISKVKKMSERGAKEEDEHLEELITEKLRGLGFKEDDANWDEKMQEWKTKPLDKNDKKFLL